jgi:hypothetical protein
MPSCSWYSLELGQHPHHTSLFSLVGTIGHSSQVAAAPPRQNNVIDHYTNQSSHIQQRNVQHNKTFITPARRSPCRPWTSSRTTVEVARKKASSLVSAGCEHRQRRHPTSTTSAAANNQSQKNHRSIRCFAKKMHLTNSSYI